MSCVSCRVSSLLGLKLLKLLDKVVDNLLLLFQGISKRPSNELIEEIFHLLVEIIRKHRLS
jgi:hypothetical protein